MERVILSGNEALARGAYEAGCLVAAAYPGTPSTEILENMAQYKDVRSKWATNEKVALEIAAGAAIGGARALAAMKQVGINVAADPLFTMGYAGVNAGLVVVTADDPGCHSSQNEQDNRLYAPHAKLAMVEPADSQECKDYIEAAYELSEQFDIPVLLRVTTRVCHAKSLVNLGERKDGGVREYVKNTGKYAMLPATARSRHVDREAQLIKLEEYSNGSPLNRVEWGDRRIGIVSSGISYQYAREVFGDDASYLKLGLTYPLPGRLIDSFAASVESLIVIEEGEPYLENAVRMRGHACMGKERLPVCGELNAAIIARAFQRDVTAQAYSVGVSAPARPPVLCAGCPHRGYFLSLYKHRKSLVAVGDIGCYSLGVNPPFEGFDISICMGAGISAALGLAEALALKGDSRKVFGMVGDSTFFHSGITGLIDVIHCRANVAVCILDNSITAMTGHQDNPGTAEGLMGEPVNPVDLVRIVRATGIGEECVRVVDPLDTGEMDRAVADAIAEVGPFVIITKSPCVLIREVAKARANLACVVDQNKCRHCHACLRIACPALANRGGAITIDAAACTACGLCARQCRFGAIAKAGE